MPFMETPLLSGSDWRAARLRFEDGPRLQDLVMRCSDFHLLIHDELPGAHEAEELLTDLPPGKTAEDKLVLGVETLNGSLMGVMDLVMDYPEKGKLFIGLFLLDPAARGKGWGKAVMMALEDWCRQQGVQKLGLGVLEHNQPARAFWQAIGFIEISRRPPRLFGQREGVVILMEKRMEMAAR
ncbi:GNAT family N-acetyltransferase [Ornatilinea apprima]|uniref:GNAT family N-acetyltransferase n=1 Tax=Ornatilinea apprima TaxID=1134406 RepID=UPI0009464A39|nr:GNAT family N-acetyltransferase [Ornatilinea apprima]